MGVHILTKIKNTDVWKKKKNVLLCYFISVIPNFSYMDFFRKCSMFCQSIPLKLHSWSSVQYLPIYFLQRRFLLNMRFLFTIYHHIIFMFYVYRHLSIMKNLKVKIDIFKIESIIFKPKNVPNLLVTVPTLDPKISSLKQRILKKVIKSFIIS